MDRSFTVKYEDSLTGVIHTDDGKTFKLVDKDKKINSKPLIIFIYDVVTMINAMMSVILWHTINNYLFEDAPFQNYVINNAIIFVTKAVVVTFGIFGVYFVFKKNSSWIIQLYSAVRLMETFMIGSLKFVYMIGLFRFWIQREEDPSETKNFKKFTDTLAVVNLFDFLTFLALNIYFSHQLWLGMKKHYRMQMVRQATMKL